MAETLNKSGEATPRILLADDTAEDLPMESQNRAGIIPPNGLSGVVEMYGQIRDYIQDDGTLSTKWVRERAAYVRCPWDCRLSWDKEIKVKRFQVHVAINDVFEQAVTKINDQGLGAELRYYGGGFNFRHQRGSAKKLSIHAFIAGWDFNPEQNPLGSDPLMHRGVVRIFESLGFTWGGRWSRPDGMHYQFAKGY